MTVPLYNVGALPIYLTINANLALAIDRDCPTEDQRVYGRLESANVRCRLYCCKLGESMLS